MMYTVARTHEMGVQKLQWRFYFYCIDQEKLLTSTKAYFEDKK